MNFTRYLLLKKEKVKNLQQGVLRSRSQQQASNNKTIKINKNSFKHYLYALIVFLKDTMKSIDD